MTAQAYLGAIGRTRMATVHITDRRGRLIAVQVYTGIDAAADPMLAEKLRGDLLNVVDLGDGEPLRIAVPVVYHDPVARRLVLVLCDAHRHRELDERIRMLEQLRDDAADVPAYAKDFAVVFGGLALAGYLEQRSPAGGDGAENDDRAAVADGLPFDDAAAYSDPFAGGAGGYDRAEAAEGVPFDDAAVFEHRGRFDGAAAFADRGAFEDRGRFDGAAAFADRGAFEDGVAIAGDAGSSADADPESAPEIMIEAGAPDPDVIAADDAAAGDATGDAADDAELRADPLTTEVAELPGEAAGDPPREPGWHGDGAGVHLVLDADQPLAGELVGPLDVRLVLHRTPSAPVIALVIGSPAALRAPHGGRFAVVALDVAGDGDRHVLRALGQRFSLALALITAGRCFRRCRLSAPLADNVGYLVRAADDHRRGIATHREPDFGHACALVLAGGFDLLGTRHPERTALRTDRLAQIATAQQLRRALAIARQFTRPEREDYLVCTRGFPLARWHELRRDAIGRAVAWGLWMGPELAQIAVSEGFARSRRDLIARLVRGFEALRHDPHAFDLGPDTTADNAAALAAQARAFGVALRAAQPNRAGAIASDIAPIAAGSINPPSPHPAAPRRSTEDLLAQLDEAAAGRGGRAQRLAAALALCDRGDPRAARPVVAAALQMSRGEAVRVLAGAVKLGTAAHPALIEGLASSKTYLRHGCALALALGRSDDATQAVIALLLSEPTELWQEIARAVGEIGTPALVWLVRNVGQHGAAADERISWAMAHVAARGGEPALTTMAVADSIVSPVAAKALDLLAITAGDRATDPGDAAAGDERDRSVNHAFSRQFFEALERGGDAEAGADAAARDAPAAVES